MDKTFRPRELDPEEQADLADPLAMPEELRPEPLNEHHRVTASQAAGVPTEDHLSEDYAMPQMRQEANLLSADEATVLRSRWDAIAAEFPSDPRRAVQQAGDLAALAMQRLTETFAAERVVIERQWGRGDEASLEEMRATLRRYRSVLQHLLGV